MPHRHEGLTLTAVSEESSPARCYSDNCSVVLLEGDLAQDRVDHWFCPGCAR